MAGAVGSYAKGREMLPNTNSATNAIRESRWNPAGSTTVCAQLICERIVPAFRVETSDTGTVDLHRDPPIWGGGHGRKNTPQGYKNPRLRIRRACRCYGGTGRIR